MASKLSSAITYMINQCSLGFILIAKSTKGLCAIMLGDQSHDLVQSLQHRFPQAQLNQGSVSEAAQIMHLVDVPSTVCSLLLDAQGTSFQQQVWEALKSIPAGTTASYTDIATRIGMPKAVRAVAQACAANPLAIVIPCHRVVKQDGSLSGYRWGVERKQILLAREKIEYFIKQA